MSDYPPDVPRLRTIERYLLLQLAAVRRAIAEAEEPQPPAVQPERWCLTWRRTPAGQPRVATLHRPDCMLATGTPVPPNEIAAVRRDPGRRLEPCDICEPRA